MGQPKNMQTESVISTKMILFDLRIRPEVWNHVSK